VRNQQAQNAGQQPEKSRNDETVGQPALQRSTNLMQSAMEGMSQSNMQFYENLHQKYFNKAK